MSAPVLSWLFINVNPQPLPLHPSNYDHILQEAAVEQNHIGWEHLLKGWISKKWEQAQEEFYKERSKQDKRINLKYHNQLTWSKMFIKGLQDIAFSTWKFCNKDIHSHDKTEEDNIKLNNLRVKVSQEYKRRHSFPAKIQWSYYTRSICDQVNDSIHMLRAWYENLQTALLAMEE